MIENTKPDEIHSSPNPEMPTSSTLRIVLEVEICLKVTEICAITPDVWFNFRTTARVWFQDYFPNRRNIVSSRVKYLQITIEIHFISKKRQEHDITAELVAVEIQIDQVCQLSKILWDGA